MINMFEVNETNNMITQEKLDVRTITMGISLLDCIDSSVEKVCENVYNKITTLAKNLVRRFTMVVLPEPVAPTKAIF